ncbi:MAG: hypothetical protein ACRELT_07485, partial [Longimicrobiales bacterium]
MGVQTRTAAACALATLIVSGCATKGQLRSAMDEERAAWNAAVAAERSERVASDERLAADLTALRS